MSDRLEELTSDWRPHHHEGWAQRWLAHMLGQVECDHHHRRPECRCQDERSDCCYVDTCQKCGAVV